MTDNNTFNIGLCIISHNGQKTNITCPTVDFVINSKTIAMNPKSTNNNTTDKDKLLINHHGNQIVVTHEVDDTIKQLNIRSKDNKDGSYIATVKVDKGIIWNEVKVYEYVSDKTSFLTIEEHLDKIRPSKAKQDLYQRLKMKYSSKE